jgi:hypothetical protein
VEKGPEYVGAKKGHKLEPDWLWHEFMPDLGASVATAATKAQEVLGAPIQLHVFAWPDSAGGQHDHVRFDGDAGNIVLEDTSAPLGVLDGLGDAADFGDVSNFLASLPKERREFYWLGVQLGCMFRLVDPDADGVDCCIEMLRCFEPWLRGGR